MTEITPTSTRPERSRGTLVQTQNSRPSTSLGTSAVGGDSRGTKHEALQAAAQAFEAVFLRQMIGSMRQASLGDELLGGGQAGEQFRELADARLADTMAEKGSFGVAEMLLKQFGVEPEAKK